MNLIHCPTCNEVIDELEFDTVNTIGWPNVHPIYCSRWGNWNNPNEWPRNPELPIKYEPLIPFKGTKEEADKLSKAIKTVNDAVKEFEDKVYKL